MQFSTEILKTLAVFHLDQPEAAWEDLRGRLKDIAEEALTLGHSEDSRSLYMGLYEEMSNHLAEAASTGRLNVTQQRGVSMAGKVLRAAQERLGGRPGDLVGIVEELECSTPVPLSRSLSVYATDGPLTFETLSGLYTTERKGNVTDSTLNTVMSNCRTLSGLLGDLDLRTHTRADMVALKEKVIAGRKPLTINKLLTQLSTVMDWAKNNGHIERSFDKGLKIERGADSTRRPFSRDEVATIMGHANSLPANDWKRWALSLGVLTGARIGEIYQLTKEDVKQDVNSITIIDINKDENTGKTLKNGSSVRLVPLVDGAYGFSLSAFLEWVDGNQGQLFKEKKHYFNKPLNDALREPLGLEAGADQSFHSLRHSLAGLLKAAATPEVIAQAITGHSSGTITYDLYAGSQRLPVGDLHGALMKAFGLVKAPLEKVQEESP
jgi:integrase